jgi:hypothetical protein
MAVRYVVVPVALAPGRRNARPPAPDLAPALAAQLDLRHIESDTAEVVYENAAWLPGRAVLDDKAVHAADGEGLEDAVRADLSGARPVLTRESSPTSFRGTVARFGDVYLAEASSSRWKLRVGGKGAERRRAFGWANAFTPATPGSATLRYRTSPLRYLALLIELALWAAAVRLLIRRRRA